MFPSSLIILIPCILTTLFLCFSLKRLFLLLIPAFFSRMPGHMMEYLGKEPASLDILAQVLNKHKKGNDYEEAEGSGLMMLSLPQLFKYRTIRRLQLANARLWPDATGEFISIFHSHSCCVSDRRGFVRVGEHRGGTICIKRADAPKQAAEVQNLNVMVWITWLVTWKMNCANFSSFFNTSKSSSYFGVSAKWGNYKDCFYDVKLGSSGSFLRLLNPVIYNIKLMIVNRINTLNLNLISKVEKKLI